MTVDYCFERSFRGVMRDRLDNDVESITTTLTGDAQGLRT